jgi:hypothetical protein
MARRKVETKRSEEEVVAIEPVMDMGERGSFSISQRVDGEIVRARAPREKLRVELHP